MLANRVWQVSPLLAAEGSGEGSAKGERSTTRAFSVWLVAVLLLGLLVRLPLIPRLGHGYDQDAYRGWMGAIQDHGLGEVFRTTDTDYVGYHYILWALGHAYGGDASQVTLRDKTLRSYLKLPGLAGDVFTTVLVGVVARSLATNRVQRLPPRWRRLADRQRLGTAEAVGLVMAALFLFHPAVIYTSAYWGQMDSLVAGFILLALWLAWRRRPEWAGVALALGTIVKPQPLVLGPLLAWLVWRQSGWSGLLRGGLAGLALLLAGHAYFIATGNTERMLEIYLFQLRQNEHLSFGAYNLWWPFERLLDARPNTLLPALGWITYGTLASAFVLLTLGTAIWILRRTTALAVLLAAGWFLAAYFLVAGGSHERYALPALVVLLPALPFTPRLRLPLLLFSAAVSANLLLGNPLDRRWTAGDPLWLTLVASLAAIVAVGWLGAVARWRGGEVAK